MKRLRWVATQSYDDARSGGSVSLPFTVQEFTRYRHAVLGRHQPWLLSPYQEGG